jgi:hypothetical protein
MHPGDHGCVIYSTSAELNLSVAEYLAEGLDASERCWYAAQSWKELADARLALQAFGVDAEQAEAQKTLWLTTSDELYLADGNFEPQRMLDIIEEAIADVLSDGLAAFRLAGEMSWALRPSPGTERVMEYEARAEELLRTSSARALCLYHRHRMPAELIDGALAVHPLAGVGAEPRPSAFYRSKVIADLRTPQPEDLGWKLKHLQRRSQ